MNASGTSIEDMTVTNPSIHDRASVMEILKSTLNAPVRTLNFPRSSMASLSADIALSIFDVGVATGVALSWKLRRVSVASR